MRRVRGFSMIEVLAAMVIFSAGAVVLFGWIGQAADRLSRLTLEQRRLFGELAALEYVRSLNPMQAIDGEALIGGARIRWHATAVGAESPVYASGSPGLYVVQLYDLKLQIEDQKAGTSTQSVYVAGWRQTREARSENPFAPRAQP